MNNGKSVTFLTGAIIGNTIDSLKLVLKLCEMKRWKSTALLLSFLTIVFVGCVAVLLIAGEPPEEKEDVPLHPIASSSYPNSSTKSSRSNGDEKHDEYQKNHDDDQHLQHRTHNIDQHEHPQLHGHRHNFRKRFTDAIKGVFSDLINSTRNNSAISSSPTLSAPTFEEHLPQQATTNRESTENNSSRSKRQLDFGSSSTEGQTTIKSDEDDSTERYSTSTTEPSAKKYTPPPKRPFLRLIKNRLSSTTRKTPPPVLSSSPPPFQLLLTSSEETPANSSVEKRGGKFRKNIRRFRPNLGRPPKLQSLSSKEKYDVSQEGKQDAPKKNFTLEVVQVERKVVRKEDGNIPPLFKKGNYNIQPRLLKVSKKEDANRPQVVYKSDPNISDSPSRTSTRQGKGASREVSKDSTSIESTVEKSEGSEERRPVVVNLNQQTPYNDHDLSVEDLKDYHDGHSTFGSKGNFTHTIISRNVAGFLPNESAENLKKNSKSDRRIVIEKGKVTERYPDRPFKNPSSEIYAVPGGRSSSTENSSPKQKAFPFTRTTKRKGVTNINREVEDNDRTSPAIPSSLADLYRKGHPGVVPAPPKLSHRTHPLDEPFGESAVYSSPFRYDPLVDDPPLKFDPESDRFYGEPIPDTKERVAQSNSPVHVENRESPEEPPSSEDYFRPKKQDGEEEKRSAPVEDDRSSSRETPTTNKPNDRFYYGRVYNPPDFATEYEADPADAGNSRDDDGDNFDFVGLDDNFGPNQDAPRGRVGIDNDFFDFPDIGGVGGGRGSRTRFRPRAGDDREEARGPDKNEDYTENTNRNEETDYDERARDREVPIERRPPPRRSRARNPDSDFEANNDYGFGPTAAGNIEDDDAHPDVYDNNGFIHTLKQFDEEIKKLQDEERQKLLQSTPNPEHEKSSEQERSTEHYQPPPPISTTSGYSKEPPLIITSPGPLERSYDSPPGPGPSTRRLEDVGTTIRVSDEEEEDVTEASPFSNSREPTISRELFDDSTGIPDRSVGAEEEVARDKGFGGNDYSTESSREVDDEK